MSSAYSLAQLLGPRRALGLVLDRLELVVVDGVDRGRRAHHRDRGRRQREAAVGIERRARHRVQAGAVRLADDHRDLRHGRLGDGADHLRAVADDPLALDLGADHEAGHVGEEQQRDVERVAGPDEARALVRGVDEQHAALDLRLVGDDPDRRARRAARSRRSPRWPSGRGSPGTSRRRASASSSSRMSNGLFSSAGSDRGSGAPTPGPQAGRRAARRRTNRGSTTGSAGRTRSPPRRWRRARGRTRSSTCASGRRPSPRASPSPRSPSRPSAASRGTSRRCRRA